MVYDGLKELLTVGIKVVETGMKYSYNLCKTQKGVVLKKYPTKLHWTP